MFWWWFGFFAFLIFAIMGLIKLKQLNINLPKTLCVRYFIFLAIIDAFYISIVYSNLICQFIFGLLCLVVLFMNLSINFINSNKNNSIKRYELLFDFLFVLAITIYLLYVVPNSNLQSIMIPIIAGVYGGLLTLVGVAWTIKKSDKDRKEDETKKIKPILILKSDFNSCQNITSTTFYCCKTNRLNEPTFNFIIKNLSNYPCKFCYIKFNEEELLFEDRNSWLESQQNVIIKLYIDNFNLQTDLGKEKVLVIEDVNGNKYNYLLTGNNFNQIISMEFIDKE